MRICELLLLKEQKKESMLNTVCTQLKSVTHTHGHVNICLTCIHIYT